MKRFFSFLAAVAMLFAASCAEDSVGTDNGNEAQVTFNLGLEGQSATRAIGDGTTVTDMYYQVFDANGVKLAVTPQPVQKAGEFSASDRTATISLQLAKGQTYYLVVWAQHNQSGYSVGDNMVVTADYDGVVSNNENRDAFCAVHKFVPGDGRTDVTLYRPFAQLNVGVTENDWNAAGNSNVNITKSEVVISKVYTTFDVRQNIFGGEVENVTFAMAATPKAANETLEVELNGTAGIQTEEQFHYLSMNYLMIGDQKDIGAKFCFATGDDVNNAKHVDFELATIPVERNHRTNIIGRLLTGDLDFNVKIDESFDGDVETLDNFVSTAIDLQAALDAAPVGKTTTIRLGADIKGDVIEFQKADRHIVIIGGDHKYDGTIKIHNGSNYNNGSITIEGVNFETETKGVNFIHAVDFNEVVNGVTRRYSNNITVKNCSFTATDEAVNTAVGVQVNATRNLQIIECTAKGLHSLLQANSCDTETITVKDCLVNGKSGVSFTQVNAAVVEGCTINAVAYGIRFAGNIDDYGILVKNNNITASQPFIVRKMTGKDNTIALEGENTLTVSASSISTEAPAYQIVITNGSDDEAYVKPTGTYTLTGADGYTMFPEPYPVATWGEFTAALAAGETDIKLTADITYDANYQLQKSVILNLGGYSMTLPMINIHTKTTIKNGTINGKVYARKNSEIVFNNVKFSGAVADNLSTEGHLAIQGGCKSLYAKDCLFSPTSVSGSQTKPLSFEGGSTIMKFENCEFKSSYKKQVYFNSLSATGSLDFTNCNFNNKTPNIMFAAACPLTNLTMSGTTKLSSVTLETNRAKDAVTAEDLAYLRGSLIANNSMSSVRLFYAGGSSEYIR